MGYTRELARIKATQKAWLYFHYGHKRRSEPPETPQSFEQWLLKGIRRVEAAGAQIKLIETRGNEERKILIDWGSRQVIWTMSDFRDEYEKARLKNTYVIGGDAIETAP